MTTESRKVILETALDASGVKTGVEQVKTAVKDMAGAVAQAGVKAGDAISGMGDGGKTAAAKVDAAAKSMIGSIQRTTALMEAGERGSAKYYEALAAQRGVSADVLRPYIDQLEAVRAKQAQAVASLNATAGGLKNVGMSANATAAAMRNVPAQFTDIVVSLQAGQAPLTVLLQQGGQLKDMFGGIGNATKALGTYVVGLINPFTVAAAAAAGLGYAFFKGSQEASEYGKALILSGNAAGVTSSQMQGYAQAISKVSGTQGAAAEAITAFAAAGQVGGDNLKTFSQAALQFAKATGQALPDVVKQFTELGNSPVAASLKLNESMNYLTESTYKQIKSLEDQGKATEAAELAQKTFSDAIASRAGQIVRNVGTIEAAWNGVKSAITKTADAALNIGRAATPKDRLDSINARISVLQEPANYQKNTGGSAFDTRPNINDPRRLAELQSLQEQAKVLQGIEILEAQRVAAQAQQADQVKGRIVFDKEGEKFLTDKVKLEREITKARNEGEAAGASELEIQKRIADIRLSKNKTGAAGTGQTEVADLKARVIQEGEYLARLKERGVQAEKLTFFEQTQIKIQAELGTNISGVARAQKEKALAVAAGGIAQEKDIVATEKRIALLKQDKDTLTRQTEAVDKLGQSTLQQAREQEAANSVHGKGKTAIEQMILSQLKLQAIEADSSDNFSPAYVAALNNQVAAQERYVKSLSGADYKAMNSHNEELLRSAKEQASLYQDELQMAGLNVLEREKMVALRQVELKFAKALADVDKSALTNEEKATQRKLINNAKELESTAAVSKVVYAEWTKFYDSIYNGLTDSLYRAFEKGGKIFKTFWDGIKNLFKTTVLKLAIQGVVGGVTGALGMGANAGGNAGSNMLGMANNISTANSLYGAATGYSPGVNAVASYLGAGSTAGASAASLGYANAVGAVGGDALGAMISANGSWGGVAASSAASAQAATAAELAWASTAAAAEGTAAAAAAASAAGTATAAGTAAVSTGAATGAAGAGAASALAAVPVYGWIALAVIAVAAYFGGRGDKEATGGGIEGSFGKSGFEGNRFSTWHQDGGWFHSDRDGKDPSALDTGAQKQLTAGYAAVQAGAARSAVALGLSADAIINYSETISLQITADQEANANAIAKMFGDIGNNMAVAVAPGLSAFAKQGESASATLARLGGSLTTVNAWMVLLHGNLLDVSMASGDAASKLVDAFGGMEAMGASVQQYYDLYFSETERAADTTARLTKAMASVGLALPDSKEKFREMASALDLSTAAGRAAYTTMLTIAPAFAASADAIAATAKTVAERVAADSAKAAEQARTIAEKRSELDLALMRATGNEAGAVAIERERELAALRAIGPGLAESKAQLYALADAATATAAQTAAAAEARTAAAEASTAAAEAEKVAADAIATSWANLKSAFDAVAADMLKDNFSALQNYRAGRIVEQLAPSGLNLSVDQVLGGNERAFNALFFSIDRTTQAGRDQATALLSVRGAFLTLTNAAHVLAQAAGDVAMSDLRNSIDAAKTALTATYDAQVAASQGAADATLAIAQASADAATQAAQDAASASTEAAQARLASITDIFGALDSAIKSTQVESLELTRARRVAAQSLLADAVAGTGRGMALTSFGGLQDALDALAQPSESLFQTFQEYAIDQARTSADTHTLRDTAASQMSVAEMTLKAVQAAGDANIEAAKAQGDAVVAAAKSASEAQISALKAQYDADTLGLDKTLEAAQQALDVANGTWRATLDVVSALGNLNAAVRLIAGTDGSHASGLAYVPFDGYRATLHEGERVMPKWENMAGASSGTVSADATVAAIGVLTQRVDMLTASLEGISRNTKQAADALVFSRDDKNTIRVKVVA